VFLIRIYQFMKYSQNIVAASVQLQEVSKKNESRIIYHEVSFLLRNYGERSISDHIGHFFFLSKSNVNKTRN